MKMRWVRKGGRVVMGRLNSLNDRYRREDGRGGKGWLKESKIRWVRKGGSEEMGISKFPENSRYKREDGRE